MADCKIAFVAVEKATFSFDILFTYLIPAHLDDVLAEGMRVCVPFGKGDRSRQAMVFEIAKFVPSAYKKPLKEIISVIDDEPVLNKSQLEVCKYVKKITFCTFYDAVNLCIPAGLKFKKKAIIKNNKPLEESEENPIRLAIIKSIGKKGTEEETLLKKHGILANNKDYLFLLENNILIKTGDYIRGIGDMSLKMVRALVAESTEEENPVQTKAIMLTPKQRDVLDFITICPACVKEICYYTGVTSGVIDNLAKKNLVEYYELEILRNPYKDAKKTESLSEVVLNPSQEAALDEIVRLKNKGNAEAILLYGVTGSGKTAVFLKAIKEVLRRKENVIMMVPEISLTAQTIQKFHSYFGANVAIMHSGLSVGQRLDEWKRIKRGECGIVIGTRSAIFAPLARVGMIVIDEEQEHSYKSDKTPRFHARDVAKFRCTTDKALLILASATPDIETYYYALMGKYKKIALEGRFNKGDLPETEIVDMRGKRQFSPNNLSDTLLEEIEKNLTSGEQTIILNNRRGFNTAVTCKGCGYIEICPNCSIALTYHKANDSLMCHYCGFSKPTSHMCSKCGSEMIKYSGTGTQSIEAALAEIFPTSRILRMDQDTTMAKFSHDKFFKAFSDGEYDILVGTQMVAKGLNFPNVTLVGVLGADRTIFSGDFKGAERTFSLITQVVGRAGRGHKPGRALIQTTDPDNYVISYGCTQDYQSFYNEEIAVREMLLYPPFCDICSVGFSSPFEEKVLEAANLFLLSLKVKIGEKYKNIPLKILGPAKMTVYRANNKFRQKLILKCKNNNTFKEMLREVIIDFNKTQTSSSPVKIVIDFSSDISF